MSGGGEWEPDAQNWIRWARTPGHDAYWYFRDAFFDDIVVPAGRRTLEIGCGEGRVARDLARRGHHVVGVDTAHTLVRAAQEKDPEGVYVLADSAALPLPDGSFDVAVAYNSLQVVGDLAQTVREAGRVLERGGQFCMCIAHPVTDLGCFAGDEADRAFTLRPAYFEHIRVDETVRRGGLTMTFRGWAYTLEDYARALEQAGLRIEVVREPQPVAGSHSYERWREVPLFLFLRAVRS